jgi:hypothetical protein
MAKQRPICDWRQVRDRVFGHDMGLTRQCRQSAAKADHIDHT